MTTPHPADDSYYIPRMPGWDAKHDLGRAALSAYQNDHSIDVNEWLTNALNDPSRQPIYGASLKFRVVSRPAGTWVLQVQTSPKGTDETDNWRDIRKPTTKVEALGQLDWQDGYLRQQPKISGNIATK